ncbi:sigma-54 dependent transcriptional regulator [Daejeonella sp.]|uniref:sigma-54-dependent transcriptional regulator n=1 Tax=Daejeonella sp. TaxID=2805397 RepID=UPI0030C0D297
MKKILIIDDEERLRSLISRILELEGYKVLQAANAKSGLEQLRKNEISVVLSDVKLPDINGVELIPHIKEISPSTEVINLTAFGNIPDGVRAIKNGAFDYIIKGDDNDKIIPLVARAMDKALLQQKVIQLERQLEDRHGFDIIIGSSEPILKAKRLAEKVSVTDTTALLLGETGTGKEIFARAIHYRSPRSDKSFVAVNCSAFSRDILESELFGHKTGAFTGAVKDKKGLFEEADLGTIFLDEIGEMCLDLQAKLLRVLEDGTFIKVGDTKTTTVNVRIIAATNRNLQVEIQKGLFREDLFYRLSVFTIELPSLNDRKEDIPAITSYYIEQFALKMNKPVPEAAKSFMEKLKNHVWKGNIRELKNMIERALILTDGPVLPVEALPIDFLNEPLVEDGFNLAIMEKGHIRRVLDHTRGNKTEAARLMGIGLTTLYRKIDEYQILIK